jgi:hypothetical protein
MFKKQMIGLSFITLVIAHGIGNAGEIVSDTSATDILQSTLEATFSEAERESITEYFTSNQAENESSAKNGKKSKGKGKNKGLPPGLARKEHLPPGLEKQLQRNGTLPPGLAKRDLPSDLASRLPPAHEGLERIIVESDVVLVEKASGIIRDIIEDIVP